MKIAFESELMQNQKHADVMAPNLAFEVLQSQEGDSLFFSIGTDNVFYLTRELTQTPTGWNMIDLSSALSSQHGGATVAAKTFSVAQNAQTLSIDLALVLTVAGVDFLYLSLGNPNTDASWANGVTWTGIPFDAGTAPSPLTIADVLLMQIPAVGGGSAVENIFVDILQAPGDPLKLLSRYYITPGASPQWNLHRLAADLAAGSIVSCLGNRTNDPIPGIYTFGTIGDEQELIFTPQFNYFQPTLPPSPARLTLPSGASAIASALNSAGVSNLFVAGTAGLYLFTPDNQHDQATPIQIVTNPIVAGASVLAASTGATQTAVWGLDPQGTLFYLVCPVGSESDAGSWSNSVPLLTGVEGFAFFLNLNANYNVLFAHQSGQNVVQLSQDPVTTDWKQRDILLPSTALNDMVSYNSFTTHIQVTDDYGVCVPNTAVQITATSPVSVYLNDVYYLLSPTVPVQTTMDSTGVLTAVQETQSLSAVCFQVVLTDTPTVVADINPMSKALTTLATIQNGTDLGNVQVTNADGTQQPLVPSSVSSSDRDAAASYLTQFSQIASGLPANGSRQSPTVAARLAASAQAPTPLRGVSFEGGCWKSVEGEDAARMLGLPTVAGGAALGEGGETRPLGSIGSTIAVDAGDFFRWLEDAFKDVLGFVVQEAEGLYHLLVKIGDEVYDTLLDCVSAVVHAVEFVFKKIEVFFEDLIKWLGFLFEWGDIVRTHQVLKNILQLYAGRVITEIDTLEDAIKNAFVGLEDKVNAWSGITGTTDPIGASESAGASTPGQGSPQSNWALHHTKSNIAASNTSYVGPNNGSSVLDQLLSTLENMVTDELSSLSDTINEIKTQVVDPFPTLTPVEVVQKLFGIVADLILNTAENFILTVLQIVQAILTGLLDLLTATIDIPILSTVYQQVTGDELSFLDLACLIAAIPVTVMYKMIAGVAPYPDNANTQALIDAPDFATLQALLGGDQAANAAMPMRQTGQELVEMSPVNIASATLDIATLFGAVAVGFLSAVKWGFSFIGATAPSPVRYAASACYLVYVAPNFPSAWNSPARWTSIMNDVVTLVSIGKTFADNTDTLSDISSWSNYGSPVVEALLNATWLAPAIGAIIENKDRQKSDWLSLGSNLGFDIGGILTPFTVPEITTPEVAAAFFAATLVLTGAYGVLSVATGGELIAEG